MRKFSLAGMMVLSVLSSAYAQRTIPMTLREMVQRSGVIVHATVARTETGRDPVTGMPATWVTLRVAENFYGASGDSYTFKQVGGEAGGLKHRLAELPEYTPGEEVVLLLAPPHRTTGFSSPMGMGQGKFRVKARPAPWKKAVEQITRSGILLKESPGSAPEEPLSFDRLTTEIRSLVKAEKGGSE